MEGEQVEGDEVVDGVVLIKSANSATGYMGVYPIGNGFRVNMGREYLAFVLTAREGAVLYAKAAKAKAEAKAEAKAKAKAEAEVAKAEAKAAKAKAKAEAEVAQAVAEADAEEKATAEAKEAKVIKRKAKAALAEAKALQAKVQAGPVTKEEAQLEVEGLQARLADLHLQIKAFELLEEMEAAEGEGEGGPSDIPDMIDFNTP